MGAVTFPTANLARRVGAAVVVVLLLASFAAAQGAAPSRKIRSKVIPPYPELARRLNLVATVKVQVTIAPSGTVLQAKAIGGHPLLIEPSVDAAKQWRYEPGPETTTSVIEFHFAPGAN